MIEITHNFDPDRFMWLWTKYVTGFNEKCHCTNAIRGRYSRKLWKGNPGLTAQPTVTLDEQPEDSYRAIYVCGVIRQGYAASRNYAHNVHAAILPVPGAQDEWVFEDWKLRVDNGRFLPIPVGAGQLPVRYQGLPDAFTSCRIFRWAAQFFDPSL
jgi:hypothetical protein